MVRYDELNIDELIPKDKLHYCRTNKLYYHDTFLTFDIEVTNFVEQECGLCYLWMVSNGNTTIYGRELSQFKELIDKINSKLDNYLVIYVHNLKYEYQFIKNMFEWDNELKKSKRNVLYCRTNKIEFRCSASLTNLSLQKLLEQRNCKIQKLDYDYNKVRTPDTVLTEDELNYCKNDVEGLHEALESILSEEKSGVASIPLTTTGYVRRDLKKAQSKWEKEWNAEMNPTDIKLYNGLHKAFWGGCCLLGSLYTDQEIVKEVYHYDINSSYPAVQVFDVFPVSPLKRYEMSGNVSLTRGKDVFLPKDERDRSHLYHIRFNKIGLKRIDYPSFLSPNNIIDGEDIKYLNNTKQITMAKMIELWCTDVDYETISMVYEWDSIEVLDCYSAKKDKIENVRLGIVSTILDYYDKKCNCDKNTIEYLNAKRNLNSIFGMAGQRLVNGVVTEDELIEQHKSMVPEPYQWGVWTASLARQRLIKGILKTEPFSFIYTDTDSIYTTQPVDLLDQSICPEIDKPFFEREYNRVLGDWEYKGKVDKFLPFSKKQYAIEENGECKITFSGLDKDVKVAKIESLQNGYTFKNVCKTAIYNDEPTYVQGYYINSSVCLIDTDYTIGQTDLERKIYLLDNTEPEEIVMRKSEEDTLTELIGVLECQNTY